MLGLKINIQVVDSQLAVASESSRDLWFECRHKLLFCQLRKQTKILGETPAMAIFITGGLHRQYVQIL